MHISTNAAAWSSSWVRWRPLPYRVGGASLRHVVRFEAHVGVNKCVANIPAGSPKVCFDEKDHREFSETGFQHKKIVPVRGRRLHLVISRHRASSIRSFRTPSRHRSYLPSETADLVETSGGWRWRRQRPGQGPLPTALRKRG